ncbi:MAG: hypothetical protein ABIS51_08285 [Sphingomonas sp.]
MKIGNLSSATMIAVLMLMAATPVDATPLQCPKDVALARLIAASDLVVTGIPETSANAITSAATHQPSPEWISVPIGAPTMLKGAAGAPLTIRIYPENISYRPSVSTLTALIDKPALLFLVRVKGETSLYFAGNSPLALQPASATAVSAASAEIARQESVLRHWKPDPTAPHVREVAKLIAQLGIIGGPAQQRIFDRVEALGPSAIPAIVAQMDIRRPLRLQQISLTNHSADSFEGMRHYGPELVVDALDAILNQLAGQGGSLVNGGSDRQRQDAVAAWQVYVADLACGRNG